MAAKAGQPRAGGEQEAGRGQRLLEQTHFLSHLSHKPEWRCRSGEPGPALSPGRHPGEVGHADVTEANRRQKSRCGEEKEVRMRKSQKVAGVGGGGVREGLSKSVI